MKINKTLGIAISLLVGLLVLGLSQARAEKPDIPNLLDRIVALEQQVADLESALAATGGNLSSRCDALETGLASEITARAGGDADLQGQIDEIPIVELPQSIADLADFVRVDLDPLNDLAGPHVIFEGANVHIRSGSGSTDDYGSLLGLGNLIVGYNEFSGGWGRGGSHNLVVGRGHSYNTSFGGLVAGYGNSIEAEAAVVTGGKWNRAIGAYSIVSGGEQNNAVADFSSVAGGKENFAYAEYSSVNGGRFNEAHGLWSTVSGGEANHAEGELSVMTGISVVEFFEYALDGDRLFNLGEFEFCQSYTETGNCWVFAPGSASGTGDPTNWSMFILDDSTCWAHCF